MSTTPARAPTQRIPSLDGLRAVSIVMVLLGHLYGTTHYPMNRGTELLGHLSHLGVQVFFVISGFLITTLLLREKERTGTVDFGYFYLRRTLRIFPAAFVYITVIAVVFHPGYLLYAYTYTMCYANQARPWVLGHLWSLSVEEQFYLLWPAALLLGFKHRRGLGWTVVLLAPVMRLIFWYAGMHEIDEYFPAVMDALMMGCLLAFYQPELRKRCPWLKHPAVFAALGVLSLTSPHLLPRVRLQILLGGLIPLILALLLYVAMERADWWLNNRVMRFAGVLSYSLYLWQQPFVNRNLHVWWTTFPANVVLAVACALGSYYVVERPFLRMFRKERDPLPETIRLGA